MLYVLIEEAVKRGAIIYCKGHFYDSTGFQIISDRVKRVNDNIFQGIIDEF